MSYPQPVNRVYVALYQSVSKLDMKIVSDNPSAGCLIAHNSHSFATDGEDITVNVAPLPTGGTAATVQSRCTSTRQIFDFGKNKKNVNKIFEGAQAYL